MRSIQRLAPSCGVLFTVVVVVAGSVPSVAHAADARAYTAGKYALQLGNEAGYVKSVDGGNMRGEVGTDAEGGKRIVRAAPEPIRAKFGADSFTQLLTSSLADSGKIQPLNGAIYTVDFNGQMQSKRDFNDAILTEISFPAFDAASKDAAFMTITLQPTTSTDFKGGGMPALKNDATKQKQWLPANFHVKLGEMPTNHVKKIEAITLTRKVASDAIGDARDNLKSPVGNWQIPNIVLYLSNSDALPYWKWAEDSLVRGNPMDKKTLIIDAMDPSMTEIYFTLTCSGVGLVSAKMDPAASGADAARDLRVELFAEKVTLTPAKGAAAAAAPTDPSASGGAGAAGGGAAAGPGAPPAPASDSPAAAGATAAPAAASGTPTAMPTGTATKKKRATATPASAPTLTPAPTTPVPIVPLPAHRAPR